LLAACALTLAAAIYGSGVFDVLHGTSSIVDPNSQSTQAQNLLNTRLNTGSTDLVILMSNASLKATDPAFTQAATQLLDKLSGRREVNSITSYYSTHAPDLISHNGHSTIALLKLTGTHGEKDSQYNALAPLITSPLLHLELGGEVVANKQFNQQVGTDLERAEMIALPITLIFLVIIFGGLVAAVLPLLIGGVAIVLSFSILRILAGYFTISSFAINVTSFIGLGLAIDYSLFIVTRFREELALDEADVQGALRRTLVTAGRTIFFSGLTVSMSLLGLLLFPEILLQSIALAAIATACVAMLAALLALPVLLAMLGPRINALSFRRASKQKPSEDPQKMGWWYYHSYRVMRWSLPITIVTIALLLLLGSPFLHASFSTADESVLPPGSSSASVLNHLKHDFSNQNSTEIDIVARTNGNATSADNLAHLSDYTKAVKGLEGVTSVTSLVDVDPRLTLANYQQIYAHPQASPQVAAVAGQLANGDLSKVIVKTNSTFDSKAATDLVKQIRALHTTAGLVPLVAGNTAQQMDLFASLRASIPVALAVMAAAIFLLLFLMTGSLVMPLKAIVLNVLSLSATFGGLVWIFQDGHLQNLLGFQSVGSLDSTQPVLIFAIAFGLSMDYEVFLLGRIKEHYDRTQNNREAVAVGLQKTGKLITSAALLLAIVVGAFATSKLIMIQQIGLGVAVAIIMDATLIRILLVPAMMNLLGKWNWWAPGPLQALQRRIGFSEGEDTHLTPPAEPEKVASLP
jgi:RND superfamily putative drug exporter